MSIAVTLDEVENIVANLSASDKSRLAKKLAKDLTGEISGIEKTPNVMGGVACIRQTRIPVWMLENARRQGVSEAELLLNYPGLTAKDLANAWDYVSLKLDEIEIDRTDIESKLRNSYFDYVVFGAVNRCSDTFLSMKSILKKQSLKM